MARNVTFKRKALIVTAAFGITLAGNDQDFTLSGPVLDGVSYVIHP